jgi:hypothetical protein
MPRVSAQAVTLELAPDEVPLPGGCRGIPSLTNRMLEQLAMLEQVAALQSRPRFDSGRLAVA